MRLMPMKFKSFVWPVNPTQLEIKENKVIQEIFVPFSKTKGKKTGKVNRQVTGRGYFTGAGSMRTFQELQKVFYQNGGGSLQLPNQLPFMAVMENLVFVGKTGENVVEYSFSFSEQSKPPKTQAKQIITEQEGDSLWEIANQFAVSIDKLIERNPHIRDIHYLKAGEKMVIS